MEMIPNQDSVGLNRKRVAGLKATSILADVQALPSASDTSHTPKSRLVSLVNTNLTSSTSSRDLIWRRYLSNSLAKEHPSFFPPFPPKMTRLSHSA